MIRKLKMKFIALTMGALFALLTVLLVAMNLLNYSSVVREADAVLTVLSQNKGDFPGGNGGGHLPPDMSPETPYESRYFSAILSPDGQVLRVDTQRITTVDDATASTYAMLAAEKERSVGFVGEFRFIRRHEPVGYRIIFLDCGRRLAAFTDFLYGSTLSAVAGYVVVFFLVVFLAGRFIRPIAESHDKQKQFITDAGHEIKTPLTIIQANADLLEMEWGDCESLADIRQQTKRLKSLTDDLVMLARMEEAEKDWESVCIQPLFCLSAMVTEALLPFRGPAARQDKQLLSRIQPELFMRGNEKIMQQLLSILLDNALKYSPTGSSILVLLEQQGKSLQLAVANVTTDPVEPAQLSRVFDRFYRTDTSRNSQTGGHGIGLSLAKAIVTAHGGRIQATTADGHSFQVTAFFPLPGKNR